jgi:uncharacterized protein (TIGR00369 family)
MTPEKRAIVAQINHGMRAAVPHNRELGLELLDFEHERGEAWMRLPHDPRLLDDARTGNLHAGAITALLDAACGMAVMIRLARPQAPIATLDLRVDHHRPSTGGLDVVAHAHCYELGRQIAFVRATAFHAPDGEPLASATATFARKDAP